jgi:hypothetical protein
MTGATLLADLRSRGIELTADGDQLRYRGPAAVFTPEVIETIRRFKSELLAALAAEVGETAASVESTATGDNSDTAPEHGHATTTVDAIPPETGNRGCISVPQPELLTGLSVVSDVVPDKADVAVLKHVLLQAAASTVRFSATDREV